MQKVMPAELLAQHIGSLVDTFAELLNKADISAYDIQIRAGKNFINMGDGDEEEDEGLNRSHKPSQDKENEEPKIVINQENDIVQLLEGFLNILDYCLGKKREDESLEEQNIIRNRQLLGRDNQGNRNLLERFITIFSSEGEQIQPESNAAIREAIFEKSDIILTACINCWNDIDIFRAREFFFTALGMFSYNVEDKMSIEKQFKKKDMDDLSNQSQHI